MIEKETPKNILVPNKIQTTKQKENSEIFLKNENFVKLDFSILDNIKNEQYSLMNGLYSKLRPGIAYINPKVNEPHELLEGRPPRKVMIDRMKKVYSTINIGSLLRKIGIDYSKKNDLDEWLPLEFFDDKELDIYTPDEWMIKSTSNEGGKLFIPGVGLKIESDGTGTWKRVLINNYDMVNETFSGYWDTNQEQITNKTALNLESMESCNLPKIHLLFDAENPYLFCKKVSLAHQEREKAESIIRYNYYIDKMLNDNLNDITDDQKTRLKKKINEKSNFFKMLETKVEELIKDLNWNFLRTTNKIIFDKYYYSKFSESLIISDLKLPENIVTTIESFEKLNVRYLGLEVIPRYNFISAYKNFTFGTLLCRREIIFCLYKIKEECYKIRDNLEIFNLNITSPLRLQKFKQLQNAALSKIEKLMCKDWIKTLKETLEKSLKNVGKGSFNLKVSSKEIYEYLKLKKYMTVCKLIMQDTLFTLVTRSITNYVEFFKKFIPDEVIVDEVNKVENKFPEEIVEEEVNTTYELAAKGEVINQKKVENIDLNQEEDEYLINPGDKWPLFKVNLVKRDDKSVDITTKPEDLLKDLKFLFEEALRKMQKVPQVEPELLSNLIKKAEGQTIPLKSIIKAGKGKPEPTPPEKIRQGYELNDDSIWIWEMYNTLDENLQKAVAPIRPYIEKFDIFKEDLQLEVNQILKQMKDDQINWTVPKIREDIIKNKARAKEILDLIPETINVSFFQINCKEFRIDLANKYTKFAEQEVELLKDRALELNKVIINNYATMKKNITLDIVTIDDLDYVKKYISEISQKLEEQEQITQDVNLIYEILDEFKISIDFAQFNFKSQMVGGPTDIKNTITSIHYTLEKKKDTLYEEQKENQKRLDEEIETLKNNIKVFDNYQSEDKYEEAYKFADQVVKNLEEIETLAQLYNNREILFEKDLTDYSELNDLKDSLDPYYWLWLSIYKWKTNTHLWYTQNFSELNGKDVQNIHDDCSQNLKAAYSRFQNMDNIKPKIIELCGEYKQICADYKNTVELAIGLTQKGYNAKHYEDILNKTNINCFPRDGFTFKHILDEGMLKYLDFCIEIGERAFREYLIGESLENIENKWKGIIFDTVLHKTTQIPNISNWNDIYKDLDNDIGEIQQLEISQFKGPYTDRISNWSKDLLNISNVLEEWNKLQRFWIYLQPVFDSSDIAKDIPAEYKKFTMTDRMWRDQMLSLKQLPGVLKNCSKEGLLDKLKEANMNLSNVEKGLNEYMEKKRTVFPRFYFISNSQFLEILSQTKDIKKVKDNLGKIFESIDDIELENESSIVKFFSRFKEEHVILESVRIYGQNVEQWMLNLEKQIFLTVRHYIEQSLIDYTENPRVDWVGRHPGQSIMCVNQIGWTMEMEKFIIGKNLNEYLATYNKKILDIVDIVRTNSSRLKAITFANLITIDVHNKQIIEQLIKNHIEETSAFEWMMQLRYYWEPLLNKMEVIVKSVQTDFPYGYEYIGNAEILVITPLTDRCYLTLMGALRLNLGGAPAGPAGTGKTESTKDLARSLAKLCIVYNCSDDTDYKMLGKFFKGLACCGAWICFDEFNRINLEVLSVIAQQLLKLFGSKENKEYEIIFEESTIKILPTFCVFITMNPGYAGRSELPDNLKALFRPIAMMVPNYGLIAEISLYSSGYVSASDLATKVVYTMKLSSEQLSSNTHYDFGMRAVKSVLNAARRLKRTEESTPEDQLLLRALEDVNVPKFLRDDIPLFRNIISDLFPTTERPKIDYDLLLSKCEQSCKNVNLLCTSYFKQKIVQLYDTLQVRHGLMIVGPAGGGKTSNYNILKDALTTMSVDDPKYFNTTAEVINPKAVKHSEIYSELDVNTGEWEFGILPTWINQFKVDISGKNKYWIIFDGPVDAMWIEDMNSVLDDSKKLCLASSDIIVLNEYITIMFEVEDLIVASPATVSRCGMVFMEPTSLGIEPVYLSWLKKLPRVFSSTKIDKTLKALFEKYIAKSLEIVRRKLNEPCPTINVGLLSSLLKIIDTFFDKFRVQEGRKTIEEEIKITEGVIEAIFYYSLIWSIGVTSDESGRVIFDKAIKELINTNITDQSLNFPDEGSVYDYCFNIDERKWIPWLNTIPQYEVPNNMTYTDIIIPTSDSIRNKYLLKILVKSNKHCISTGPTGTGKTIGINELISREMGDKYTSFNMNFSAQTTARQTQDSLDSKLKKKGRNLYAPDNNKTGVVFVDDLNMPVRQTSGAQPPIEFIRQWLDHRQWYDLFTKKPKIVNDLVIIGAMGPPVGGRSLITQRFQRHFNILGYTELEDTSIKLIFTTKLNYFLNKYSDEIKGVIEDLIKNSLDVYKEIKKELLPIPGKMHYIFNLRDMSKVIQGISSVTKTVTQKVEVVRLWSHEITRVFGDRLINDQDRDWLFNLIKEKYSSNFNLSYDEIHNTGKKIIFCDFNKGDKTRSYSQTLDFSDLIKVINLKLDDFNTGPGKKKPLYLVMFLDACDHVCRISRILRQPGGNALLFGVGGSGRQSLAKLSTFINSYDCCTIEVGKGYSLADFTKSVKDCLMKCGNPKDNSQTFLLVDTQLIFQNMLEIVNNILNTGEVAGIYKPDDMETIRNLCKDETKRSYGTLSDTNIMKVFTSRVVKSIHIVLAMSPIGDIFSQRLRNFPSLVACSTIDWFSEWPEDALESVAKEKIKAFDLKIDEYEDAVVNSFKFIHKSVERESKAFSQKLRKYFWLTPTSYLELINMYKKVLLLKRDEIQKGKDRLETGLKVLKSAEAKVSVMKDNINKQQPELEKKVAQTNILVEDLKVKNDAAEIERIDAEEKTNQANIIAKTCEELVEQANIEFLKVKPLIDQAMNAIKNVKKSDLDGIRKISVLNPKVEFVMEALLIFKKADSWKTKEMLLKVQNPPDKDGNVRSPYDIKDCLMKKINFNDTDSLLKELGGFGNEENLNKLKNEYARNMELLEQFIKSSNYTRKDVVNGAEIIVGLYDFFTLMVNYVNDCRDKIDVTLEKVAVANKQKEEAEGQKREAIAKKDAVQAMVDELNRKLSKEQSELQSLKDNLDEQKIKLGRAEQLIQLLSTEKERWEKTVAQLTQEINNLVGDCIIAASAIAYNGPFTYEYRENLEKLWLEKINELNIICTPNTTMKSKLEDKIKLREWIVNGLPQDNLSIENAIIINYTRRFPLIIDPQNQGSNFIKKQGKRSGAIEICKANDPSFMNIIGNCIKNDKMCIVEGVGINLDPALDFILTQGNDTTIKYQEYNYPIANFKLFLSTTLPNPHYSPETFVKVTIINFGITPKGLEEQMMTLLINNEMPELEQRKNTILMENFQSTKELRNTEDNILEMLSSSKGDIDQFLKSDNLIVTLQESKTKSEEINRKMAESEETAKEIDKKRENYRSAAYRGSLLFFATIDLANISPMYQFSLQWYAKLYENSIKNTPPNLQVSIRVTNLNKTFLKMLYENVCRSLFEKDKLLYSMLITYKLLVGEHGEEKLSVAEWKYFLSGPSGEFTIPKCSVDWISTNEWPIIYKQIKFMDDYFPKVRGIENYFLGNLREFKPIYDSPNAHTERLPGEWENKFVDFTRLLILKALRPDKLVLGINIWISNSIGPEFIEAPGYNLPKSYKESNNITPIVFILSPGSDPINDIKDYTVTMGYEKKFDFVSLGRGQEKRAVDALESMRNQGGWALLQNCHLAPSFMGKLEEIVENFDTNWPDKDFRLWLTSTETDKFPPSILQNSVKITIEPPKGLRNNLKRSYNKLDNKDIEDCTKPNEFKCLLFGLSFFHAIVQDRRKYGPIGWNDKYDFTNEDWLVSKKQLKIFLEQYQEVPFKVIDFLIGDINYGGRVTDDKDQRLIKNILSTYITDKIFDTSKYNFSKSGIYYCPDIGDHEVYMTYIENLPQDSPPEVFGMHENADITTAQNEASDLLDTILNVQPKDSGGEGKGASEILLGIANDIEKKVGKKFDIEYVFQMYPTDYNESMNTVLLQEVIKYNKLIGTMKSSLETLKLALAGKIVMSEDIEKMSSSLLVNQVPDMWGKVFLSLKPLSSWIEDYSMRITFLRDWIDKGTPAIFWFPGFSFPQAFLTAALQNYARKMKYPIDKLSFGFKINDTQKPSDIKTKPEIGCYLYGCFLEGARWNDKTHILDDSNPKELYVDFPIIHLVPEYERKPPEYGVYECPLYKVLSRKGTLSTTGHSTNFVIMVEIPTDLLQNVWIKAGVAMFLSLKQ